MGVTTRRAILGGGCATLVAGGTVAAATILRKPKPPIYTLVSDAEPSLESMAALKPTVPPAALPSFGFLDAKGDRHGMAEFAGRGVVLNFWATWCGPCVAELPSLMVLAGRVAGRGVVVLPLSTDRGGQTVVRAFYASHGIDGLGVWLDPKGEAAEAFGLRGLPTTVIVGRDGRERGRLEGGAAWGSDAAVERVLALAG
jgi:thiol-disulfide isomerase/thioredoxin